MPRKSTSRGGFRQLADSGRLPETEPPDVGNRHKKDSSYEELNTVASEHSVCGGAGNRWGRIRGSSDGRLAQLLQDLWVDSAADGHDAARNQHLGCKYPPHLEQIGQPTRNYSGTAVNFASSYGGYSSGNLYASTAANSISVLSHGCMPKVT